MSWNRFPTLRTLYTRHHLSNKSSIQTSNSYTRNVLSRSHQTTSSSIQSHTLFDINQKPRLLRRKSMVEQVKFQIQSDLHLEMGFNKYNKYDIIRTAPYLALLGDIGRVKDKLFFSFIERQLSKFQIVFLVLGNHEAYGSDWETTIQRVETFEKDIGIKKHSPTSNSEGNPEIGRFVFLNRTRYDFPSSNVTVLGCTLFSNILTSHAEEIEQRLNDFHEIDKGSWTVEQHNKYHKRDLKWLNDQVMTLATYSPDRKIIIFTHHCPTFSLQANDPKHVGTLIQSGFCSDLEKEFCWIVGGVRMWAYGHTHFNCDFVERETGKRVVTNQKVYMRPGKDKEVGFAGGKVFVV